MRDIFQHTRKPFVLFTCSTNRASDIQKRNDIPAFQLLMKCVVVYRKEGKVERVETSSDDAEEWNG